jgi:hypothetical protein
MNEDSIVVMVAKRKTSLTLSAGLDFERGKHKKRE